MSTLAADTPRDYSNAIDPWFEELPVIASDIIYEGAAVGDNASGYMRPLAAGDEFRGFAVANVDNSTGSAGDKRVKLRRQGIVSLAVTGATAVTDVGKPVYASDDATFTLTPTASEIGTVAKWVTSTTCLVYFKASQLKDNAAGRNREHIVGKAANFNVVMPADNGKTFNITAAATATLPASAAANIGCWCDFICAADVDWAIAGTAGELVTLGDLAANSVTVGTGSEKIGGRLRATQISSTKWHITPFLWSDVGGVTQTATVAT